ncbi:MAG TPA: hypothetical protein VMU19_08365, partial [Bryobacteraceae bacterium]|nr:hypothetical protein [Bryobacteraceae bacterium]
PSAAGRHAPPASFKPGAPLPVEFAAGKDYTAVQLYYRHVNHAERWQSLAMQSTARTWKAAIPADYTGAPYPLQYYFELRESPEAAALYPGLGEQLTNQPYFAVRRG